MSSVSVALVRTVVEATRRRYTRVELKILSEWPRSQLVRFSNHQLLEEPAVAETEIVLVGGGGAGAEFGVGAVACVPR